MKANKETFSLVAHIVWDGDPSADEQKMHLEELNAIMKDYLPSTFEMAAYSVHDIMLPYSPTTLKKDKNRLSKQTDGYVQVIDGEIKNIESFASALIVLALSAGWLLFRKCGRKN